MTTRYRQAQEKLERDAFDAILKIYPEHAVTVNRFSMSSTATRRVGVLLQIELPDHEDDWPPVEGEDAK